MANQLDTSSQTSGMIEAEVRAEHATAQTFRVSWDGCIDTKMQPRDNYWVDLCLTPRPRNVHACYPDRWGSHRFEHIGTLFIIPPQEIFHARCEHPNKNADSSQSSVICEIKPELMRQYFDGELQWNKRQLEGGLDIPDRSIRGLMLRLARELTFPGFAGEMIVELVASQLAIELGRYFANGKFIIVKGGLAAAHLRIIDERVKALGKAPTLSELASLCKISVRHLSRGFQTSRGCSIGTYVEQSCLEHAKHLILSGEPIAKVACTLGYSSRSSFSCAFRRTLGLTPAQFRKLA